MLWFLGFLFYGLTLLWGCWLGNRLLYGYGSQHGLSGGWVLAGWWLGWYIQSILVLLIGRFLSLNIAVLMSFILFPLAFVWLDRRFLFHVLKVFLTSLSSFLKAHRGISSLWVVLLIWLGLHLSAPPFFYDTLFYHYGQPAYWIAHQKIIATGPDTNAYLPMPTRMHLLLGLDVVGDEYAVWVIVGNILACVLMVGFILKEVFEASPPLPAVAMLLLTMSPMLWEEVLYRLVDVSAALGGAILFYVAGMTRRSRVPAEKQLYLMVVMTAILLTTKPAVTLGYSIGCWFYASILSKNRWMGFRRISWILAGFLACVLIAPWVWNAWSLSGHPMTALKPYLGKWPLFSTRWEGLHFRRFHGGDAWQVLLDGANFFRAFLFPAPHLPANRAGLLILMVIPAMWISRGLVREKWVWWLGLAGVYFTFRLPRYSMVLLPLSVVLVVLWMSKRMTIKRMLGFIIVFFLLDAGIHLYRPWTGIPFRYSVGRLFGLSTASVQPSSVRVCQWANLNLSERDVYLLFVGETRYYPCHLRFYYWNPMFRHPMEILKAGTPPESTWDEVLRRGYTHIIYTPEEARRLFEWPERVHRRFDRWLKKRCRLLFQASDSAKTTYLYECSQEN